LYRQQSLADGVVDFVRAGVQKIFALEIDFRAAEMRGEARGELQRCGRPAKFFSKSWNLA